MKFDPRNETFLCTNITGRAFFNREHNNEEYNIPIHDYKNFPIKGMRGSGPSMQMYSQIRSLLTESYWLSSPK